MAEEEKGVGGFEGPKEGGELLAVLVRYIKLPESAILREISVDLQTVRRWEDELAASGWIKPVDRSLSDPVLELSKEYDKKIHAVRETARKAAPLEKTKKGPEVTEEPKPKSAKGAVFFYDMVVLVAIVLSVSLFAKFIKNPGVHSASFFAGAFLLFVAVLVRRSYGRFVVKEKKTVKASFMLSVLREVLAARFKHIILFALFLLALVFAGRFVVLRDPTNLLLLVLPLSTIPIILLHKGTTAFLVRYYVGMLVLAYAILLLLGLFSVSTYFLGGAARWFDVIIALFLMGLVRLSERVFGVGISFVLDLVSSQKNPK